MLEWFVECERVPLVAFGSRKELSVFCVSHIAQVKSHKKLSLRLTSLTDLGWTRYTQQRSNDLVGHLSKSVLLAGQLRAGTPRPLGCPAFSSVAVPRPTTTPISVSAPASVSVGLVHVAEQCRHQRCTTSGGSE